MFDAAKPIGECTAQELAIAQIIGASAGRFDADRVLSDLDAHRALWRSFLMGRAMMPAFNGELPMGGLLPLRDL